MLTNNEKCKKYDGYVHLSIQKYANPMLEKLWESLESRQERMFEHIASDESEYMVGQTKAVFLQYYQELIDGNLYSIKNTHKRIDAGEFVDDSLCTNGLWIDMKSYYEDIIIANEEKINSLESFEKLSEGAKKTIEKLRGINLAYQKRIDTNRLEVPEPHNGDGINTGKKLEMKIGKKRERKEMKLNDALKDANKKLEQYSL